MGRFIVCRKGTASPCASRAITPAESILFSNCGLEDPPLTFELIICTDSDDDEINDYEDNCPNSDLTGDLGGTVVIDGCDSLVDNVLTLRMGAPFPI